MKRYLFGIGSVCLFFLMVSCTGLQNLRTVDENNVFISPGKPKIRLKINENFQYMENANSSSSASSFSGGENSTNEKVERFIFDNTKEDGKRIVISVARLNSSNWYYMYPLLGDDEALQYGKMTIGGNEYEYRIDVDKDSKETALIKTIARRVGAKNNGKFVIHYFETVDGDWEGSAQYLSDTQKNRLKEFNQDFLKAFEVL